MKFPKHSLFVALAASACALAVAAEDAWTPLFNGKDSTGWKNPYDFGKVEVVDNEIHLTASKKFFLVTEKTYSDFIFEGEVHLPEGPANSGFMFRANVEPGKVYGYQAEVDGDENRGWSGGLYDEGRRGWVNPTHKKRTKDKELAKTAEETQAAMAKLKDTLKRNDWNKYRIECKGDHIQIFVNGVKTTDLRDSLDSEGHIGIQHHGEEGATYRFRNLRIQELPQEEELPDEEM